MKLVTLILVAVFLAGCATGENIPPLGAAGGWVKIGEHKESGVAHYANPETIRKTGNNIVNMVILEDHNGLRGIFFRYKSIEIEKKFYCESNLAQRMRMVFWSGNMAKGMPVYGMGPNEFAEPGVGPAWKYACKK